MNHIWKRHIPLDSFENEQSTGVTNDPKTCSETLVASQPQPSSQKSVIDNQSVFRAEKILQSRKKKGQKQFLVKWYGYPRKEATWEPEENILDKRLIENFERSRK